MNFPVYSYKPLDEAAQEIRLLTLHSGAFIAPIVVTLLMTSFTKDNIPAFEALLYTWGSPENPVDILINQATDQGTLSITRNLGEALLYLRYEDKPRILWIDAICVNQQDLDKRSQQVKRMADIYSRATRVVVWLGPERADTSLAIAFFNKIASHIVVEWEQMIVRPNSSDDVLWQTRALERFSSDDSILVAVDDLLSRLWFGRLWIWQEIHLATSATVFCGTKSIPWHAVRISVVWLNWIFMNIGTIPLPSLHESIQSPLDLCTYLLYQTRYCKCSDKRDRIFALLSLGCPYPSIDIQPDYTKTVEEVFMDTMQKVVHCSKSLEVLSTAEMKISEGSTNTSSLPS
jgi:hypothetical protein